MAAIVTDEDVEKALDFLRANSFKAAKARAERVYLEEFRKTKKALLMKQAMVEHNGPGDLPVSAQEREAYAHPDYQEFLKGLRAGVEEDEKARFGMLAAQSIIDAWRTQQANARVMEKIV